MREDPSFNGPELASITSNPEKEGWDANNLKFVKPRLAKILGVEVMEPFAFDYPNRPYKSAYIDYDGIMRTAVGKSVSKIGGEAVCWLINHPEALRKLPKLSEMELAICKALCAKWVSMDIYDNVDIVTLWSVKPFCLDDEKTFFYADDINTKLIATVKRRMFPSVRPGDCIEVCYD